MKSDLRVVQGIQIRDSKNAWFQAILGGFSDSQRVKTAFMSLVGVVNTLVIHQNDRKDPTYLMSEIEPPT